MCIRDRIKAAEIEKILRDKEELQKILYILKLIIIQIVNGLVWE